MDPGRSQWILVDPNRSWWILMNPDGSYDPSGSAFSPLAVRRTESILSSIAVVRLSGKQEMQASIPCERDHPFVLFCCHSVTLLLSHNKRS
jgi:hypothetical protein